MLAHAPLMWYRPNPAHARIVRDVCYSVQRLRLFVLLCMHVQWIKKKKLNTQV